MVSPLASIFASDETIEVTINGHVRSPGKYEVSKDKAFLELLRKARPLQQAFFGNVKVVSKSRSEVFKVTAPNLQNASDKKFHLLNGNEVYIQELLLIKEDVYHDMPIERLPEYFVHAKEEE